MMDYDDLCQACKGYDDTWSDDCFCDECRKKISDGGGDIK